MPSKYTWTGGKWSPARIRSAYSLTVSGSMVARGCVPPSVRMASSGRSFSVGKGSGVFVVIGC